MADRTTTIPLIRLITLATGLAIGGNVSASVIEVNTQTLPVIGHAPVVAGVQFNNTAPAVNDTVTATPTITDEDGDKQETRYQWKLDGKDIPNATQDSYRLVPGDGNGRQLSVVVTPQTDPAITEPATGNAYPSSTITTKGSAPEAYNVEIDGKVEIGEVVTGNYRYYDRDGSSDSEGSTSFEWRCELSGKTQVLTTSQTYRVRSSDIGCKLSFNVTPRSQRGTPDTGAQARSDKVIVPETIPTFNVDIFNGNQIGNHSGYGYNLVINYGYLGYGTPTSITVYEYLKGSSSAKKKGPYNVGSTTSSHSKVVDDGYSIKYGTNASKSIGDTIYVATVLTFKNGKTARATSSEITLQG